MDGSKVRDWGDTEKTATIKVNFPRFDGHFDEPGL